MSSSKPSKPQFLYPPSQKDDYQFNPTDQVNVSWTWDNPPAGASVGLFLWLQNSTDESYYFVALNETGLPVDGFSISRLKFPRAKYPNLAHFNLIAYFANGTSVAGPNSMRMNLDDSHEASPCRNCTGSQPSATTGSISSPNSTSATSSSPVSDSQNSGLSASAIAGIAVGVVVVVLAILAGIFLFIRRRRKSQHPRYSAPGNEKAYPDRPPSPKSLGTQGPSAPATVNGTTLVAEKDSTPIPRELPGHNMHEMSAETQSL